MTAPQKQVLVIENSVGSAMTLNMLLRQAGIAMQFVRTVAEARDYMNAGWPFTGVIIQGKSTETLGTGESIENTLQFLRDLEAMQYPGKVYVLSSTDYNNPAFREAASSVLTNVYDKVAVFTGQQPLEF